MRTVLLPTGMGYVITVEDKGGDEVARFEVEDVERVPWGLAATITVRTSLVGARTLASGYLTTERVSLLNSKSRGDLANRLDALIPHPPSGVPIDWTRVIDDVVLAIIEAEKRPLSVLDLSEVAPSADETYLVPGLLPVGKTTILYGAGGTGKSALAAAIAAAVQTGVSFLGWPIEQANVLYLDWETDAGDLADRVTRCSAGIGLRSAAPVRYINLTGPLMHHQGAIASVCAEKSIGLVIIDSVGMATAGARDGGDMADGAITFFRALRSLKASVLAIDHVSSDDLKRVKGGASKPFGSVFKVNAARNTFELVDTTIPGVTDHRVTMRHRKTNTGPRMTDVSMLVDWQATYIRFQRDGYVVAVAPLDTRVMDILSTGPSAPRALAELLNDDGTGEVVSEREVREVIADLRRDGMVTIDQTTGVVRIPKEEPKVEQPTLELGVEPEPDA